MVYEAFEDHAELPTAAEAGAGALVKDLSNSASYFRAIALIAENRLLWATNKLAFETVPSPYGRSGWQIWQGV